MTMSETLAHRVVISPASALSILFWPCSMAVMTSRSPDTLYRTSPTDTISSSSSDMVERLLSPPRLITIGTSRFSGRGTVSSLVTPHRRHSTTIFSRWSLFPSVLALWTLCFVSPPHVGHWRIRVEGVGYVIGRWNTFGYKSFGGHWGIRAYTYLYKTSFLSTMVIPLDVDEVLLAFTVILVLGLFIPEMEHRWNLPLVPLYIMAGIIIGPYGLDFIDSAPALSFLGELGLFFLVFMAGLDVSKAGKVKWHHVSILSLIFGALCFIAGFSYIWFFSGPLSGGMVDYPATSALLVGVILMSSSVGEIIPMVKAKSSLVDRMGPVIIPGVVVLDGASLVGIAFLTKDPSSPMSMVVFIILVAVFFISTAIIVPRVARWYFSKQTTLSRESDLKFLISVLFVVVAVSELIKLHGIAASFFAGVLISESLPNKREITRLEGIGHTLLIPTFFIVLGIETNIRLIWEALPYFALALGLLATLIISKTVSGVVYAIVTRKSIREGLFTGLLFWPQLSATLAATQVGKEYGIVDEPLFVSVIFRAITTALITPFIVRLIWKEKRIDLGAEDHIILIGAGSIGSFIKEALMEQDVQFVVVESDLDKIRTLRKDWVPCIFGDASKKNILKNAGVDEAAMVVICIGDDKQTEIIAHTVRKLNPRCPIIARVHTDLYAARMEKKGFLIIRPEKVVSDTILQEISDLVERIKASRKEQEETEEKEKEHADTPGGENVEPTQDPPPAEPLEEAAGGT
ncbi:MAG: cation:proton antiporter [Thermoplasmata archaeon]|nr:cation:proton antiporter [Thermoplasmata archaeon]